MSASLEKSLTNVIEKTTNRAFQVFLSRWLTIILFLFTAWMLGNLIWKFISPTAPLTPWQPVTQPTQTSNTISTPQVDTQALVNSNMFGQYTAQPVAKPVVDAPETRLNLTLVGVVASTNGQKSLAVIANGGVQVTYGVDETIEGTDAKLVSVLSDRVIISNRGAQEALMLEGIDYSKRSRDNLPMTGSAQAANSGVEDLDAIKASILQDPQKAFQYIRLSQKMLDGQLKGYQVRPGSNRALFDAVGLQDGDVAVEMNGKDLTDASQMATLWSEAAAADSWDLTVERDGQLHQIHIGF